MLTFFHRIRKRQAMVCLFVQSIIFLWLFSPVLLAVEWKQGPQQSEKENEKSESRV